MITSTISEAQSDLSKLIGLAEKGEEIVIAQGGKPVARIVPYERTNEPRKGGQWKGKIRIAPDFDELPSDIGNAFGVAPQ
ncbi:MAG: type II toxin-antitoxin system prevent-host-death family antitoxin [Pirellulaceae bacterium]|nr:type II toxin-antitoxin system prevent-host-death family antitoxin [Pirellulaceae bacterium]